MPFLFCLPGPAAQRAQDGSPIRRAKNARSRRPSAPPATSPQKIRPVAQKFGPTTRHAMPLRLPRRREKVRSATRRAMPQADRGPPKRAPYGSHAAPVPAAKILLLAAAPRPHRPACRAAAKKSGQPHAAPCRRPTAGRQSARRMAATPRPSLPQKYSCWPPRRDPIAPPVTFPRTIRPTAQKLGSTRPDAPPQPRRKNNPAAARPRPKARAPARTGEGRVSRLSVSFLPLKMAAARNRKNRSARSPKQQRAAVRPSHRCAKSCQPHAAPCRRPTADRQSARRMAATPRPAPPRK